MQVLLTWTSRLLLRILKYSEVDPRSFCSIDHTVMQALPPGRKHRNISFTAAILSKKRHT